MLIRRHRDRLEEFVRPQAGAHDYPQGEQGAAEDEPGGPSSDTGDDRPAGNASRDDWAAYALAQGADEADVEGLSRDELREQYGA